MDDAGTPVPDARVSVEAPETFRARFQEILDYSTAQTFDTRTDGTGRFELAVAGPVPEIADLVRLGVRPLSPTGVLGDPTGASAEDGQRLFDALARQLAEAVAHWAG